MGLGYLFCFQGGSRKLDESSFYHALHEQRIESVALDSDGHVSVEVEPPRRQSMLFHVVRGIFLLLFATTILLHLLDLHAEGIGRGNHRGGAAPVDRVLRSVDRSTTENGMSCWSSSLSSDFDIRLTR